MKVVYQCEFCGFSGEDVGLVKTHEVGCYENPKNQSIDGLIGKYGNLIEEYRYYDDEYNNGMINAFEIVITDLSFIKHKYKEI